jgi:ATP-binding cassette subfamily B protein
VEFDNVSYKYPNTDQLVVKDFSLDVKPGECIAVVGSSGSGKSTLMNLIIGLLVPTDGAFKIDGKPLTEFNLSEYRHHISVVPQNSILFAGTIRENITYGLSRYSEEDLQRAVEMANLSDLLKELPRGIDTNIGEHGDKLSGGQKQRITIARALIRNPKS